MKKQFKNSLFIFRRDLRLDDNTALLEAARYSDQVIACFIFDPRQVGIQNKYRSLHAMQAMIESLQDLESQLARRGGKLYLFSGAAEKVVNQLFKRHKIDALFVNKDYTPFSIKRDKALEQICKTHQVAFHAYHDLLLINPDTIKTAQGSCYRIFTPFYNYCRMHVMVARPSYYKYGNFFTGTLYGNKTLASYVTILSQKNRYKLKAVGGRSRALAILKNIKQFRLYSKEHDFPAKPTTGLSVHHKFGTISIRESYHIVVRVLGKQHPLIRQLYWRDFFTYIAYHAPRVFGSAFQEKYNELSWSNSLNQFKLWTQGKTGFPIIDAGMRELNETGFMHNRVRLLVASFLVKDLHIDWRWGEQYFAQQLVDYDPAVNNGNWQWVASTGADAQPFFRIFNPWLQQKKFDPKVLYIKQWVPELKDLDPNIIHTWYTAATNFDIDYPKPIIDHNDEVVRTKKIYKKLS